MDVSCKRSRPGRGSAEADGSLRRDREWESSAANVRSASCRPEKNRLGILDMGPPNKNPAWRERRRIVLNSYLTAELRDLRV